MFVKRGGFKTVTISSVLLGFVFSMSVCLQYKLICYDCYKSTISVCSDST